MRPHELWGNSSRHVKESGFGRAESAPSAASLPPAEMLALAGDVPHCMGPGCGCGMHDAELPWMDAGHGACFQPSPISGLTKRNLQGSLI